MVGVTGTAGCTGLFGDGGGDIQIGYLAPLTGPAAFAGENGQNGLEISRSEINSETVNDREVSIRTQDTATDPQQTVSGFETLRSQGVAAIIGGTSFTMPNIVEQIVEEEVLFITPFATTAELNDVGGEWLWRTQSNDSIIGRGLGEYPLQQDWDRMAVALENERGTQSLATVAIEYFENNGGTISEEIVLPENADSFRGEVDQLIESDPDMIYISALEDVGSLFVQNYIESGTDIPLLISDEITNQNFIDLFEGGDLEGILGITLAPGPTADQFAGKHEEEYGGGPGPFAASTYDALNVLALAMQQAGSTDGADISEGMRAVGGPPGDEATTFPEGKEILNEDDDVNLIGAATPLNFNENGDVLGPVAIQEVQDDSWETIQVLNEDELT